MDITYSKSNTEVKARVKIGKTVQYCAIEQWYTVTSTECVNVLTPEYFDSTFRYLYSIQLQCVKIAAIFISCYNKVSI